MILLSFNIYISKPQKIQMGWRAWKKTQIVFFNYYYLYILYIIRKKKRYFLNKNTKKKPQKSNGCLLDDRTVSREPLWADSIRRQGNPWCDGFCILHLLYHVEFGSSCTSATLVFNSLKTQAAPLKTMTLGNTFPSSVLWIPLHSIDLFLPAPLHLFLTPLYLFLLLLNYFSFTFHFMDSNFQA